MKIYGVINMDIVGSRLIREREKFQNRLNEIISVVCQKYSRILPAPISITLGDEWQLITDVPSECYNLVHEFQQLLWLEGAELYAGIGIGDISTSVYDDIRKMDGTSFHIAREALNAAKRKVKQKGRYSGSKRNKIAFQSSRNAVSGLEYLFLPGSGKNFGDMTYFKETAEEIAAVKPADIQPHEAYQRYYMDDIINTLIENNEILKSKMTQKQKEVYVSYKKYGSYREIIHMQAAGPGQSTAAISQKLNTAEYFTIQHNHEMVERLMKYYCTLRGAAE